jgi:hypothetical protein
MKILCYNHANNSHYFAYVESINPDGTIHATITEHGKKVLFMITWSATFGKWEIQSAHSLDKP